MKPKQPPWQWIAERIKAEQGKYEKNLGDEWYSIAAVKILSQFQIHKNQPALSKRGKKLKR